MTRRRDGRSAWRRGVCGWTEEIVEALPDHEADHLSRLSWESAAVAVGMRVSYRTAGPLRMSGAAWYLGNVGGGTLANLDYLDATSDEVTHRSVSPAGLVGAGWEVSTHVMLVEVRRADVFLRSFARIGYRGAYHVWGARGGEYEYPDRQGRFADDQELIRYLVLHQVFEVGAFVELGRAGRGSTGGWAERSRRRWSMTGTRTC